MRHHIGVQFILALLLLGLVGCSPEPPGIAAPVTPGQNLALMHVWALLQQELELDPSSPAWLDDLHWQFEPDGSLRTFLMVFEARSRADRKWAVYQVEGDGERWTLMRTSFRPRGQAGRAAVGRFLTALDALGVPSGLLRQAEPADYYSFKLHLGGGLSENATGLVVEGGRVRPITEADEALVETGIFLHAFEMHMDSPNTAHSGPHRIDYLIP